MPAKYAARLFLCVATCALVTVVASALTPEVGSPMPQPTPPATQPAHPMSAGTEYLEDSPENIAVLRALDRTEVSLSGEHKLADALKSLRDQSNLNMIVNWAALQAQGIDRMTSVSLTLRDVPLSRALRAALDQVSNANARLSYAVDGGIIVVSTREDLSTAKYQAVRMYNVSDLIALPSEHEGATERGPDITEGNFSPSDGRGPAATGDQVRVDRATYLMDTIKSIIAPDTWRDGGGTIGAIREFDGVLIVTQTNENQHAVEHFLTQLRSVRAAAAR